MAQELLYTSAPRGLKPGSRGFCTVEATAGLPPTLAAALEGLSGYRHIAPPGDSSNPIVYSHVTLTIGGRAKSVLSRVADAGADYSGRTNKIAHHVAIDPPERPAGGPAWLLGRSDLLKSAYAGEPKTLPPRKLPAGDRPAAVCNAWKAVTGDAGWAGVLAEAFLADPNRPVYLIVPPDLEVRGLFEEAIALLPPDRRWGVTFTTFYTSLPQSITCQWRAVLAGSKEAHESRRFVQALRLDLTSPLSGATGGALVETARAGRSTTAPPPIPKPAKAATPLLATAAPAVDEETPLDVMPQVSLSRPEMLRETSAPPEIRQRSKLNSALWVLAGVACLAVAATPIIIGTMHWAKKGTAPVNAAEARASGSGHSSSTISTAPEPIISSDGPPLSQAPAIRDDAASGVTDLAVSGEHDLNQASLEIHNKDEAGEPAPSPEAGLAEADSAQSEVQSKVAAEDVGENQVHTIVLDRAPAEASHYYAEEIVDSENSSRSLQFFLTRSAAGRFEIKENGARQVTIRRKDLGSTIVCRIFFGKHPSDQLQIDGGPRGDLREIPLILSLGALKVLEDDGTIVGTYVLALSKPRAAKVPPRFSGGAVQWKFEIVQELQESLELKSITIEPSQGKQFTFTQMDSPGASLPPLTSAALDTVISEEVRLPDLVETIKGDPTRIEVISDSASGWNLRMKPGAYWTGFKTALTESLSRKKDVYILALGSNAPAPPIEKYFRFSGVRNDEGEAIIRDMRKRFQEAITIAADDVAKAKKDLDGSKKEGRDEAQLRLDQCASRHTSLVECKNEYELYVRAANSVHDSDRHELFESRIIEARVAYEVVNGDAILAIPFHVDIQ